MDLGRTGRVTFVSLVQGSGVRRVTFVSLVRVAVAAVRMDLGRTGWCTFSQTMILATPPYSQHLGSGTQC
eukprot:8514388-Pyramimonas_sp.AAC.1